jgi:hypothetical protein
LKLGSAPIVKFAVTLCMAIPNVIYRLMTDVFIIVALAHQSRRPGYWADRR